MDKFIVYVEEIESLKELSNEEIGIFFRAVTEYVKSGIVPNLPERLIFPFRFITAHISRDQKKYKDISEKRKIAGKKGLDSRMKNKENCLSEENEKYVENVKKCVGEAEKYVGEAEKYVGEAEKYVEEAEQYVGEAEKYVEEAEQYVGEAEQYVEEAEQRVGEVEQHVGEAEQRVGDINHHSGKFEKCVENIKKCIEDTEKRVEDTEQYSGKAEKCVENVERYTESIINDNGTDGFNEDNGGDIGEYFDKNVENVSEGFAQDKETSIEEDFKKKGGRNIKECFEEFWNAYPNKMERNGAAIEYMCMFTGKKSHSKIMDALKEFKKSEEWKKGDGTNVPPPQKWLSDLKKFGDKPFIFSSS